MPKIRKMRRTDRSVSTPRTAPKASDETLPVGMTSGRTSREPNATSSAVPTDSAADSQKTPAAASRSPSIEDARRATGPTANPIGPDAPKTRDRHPEPAQRRHVADAREHHAGVAQLEPDEQHREGELPGLPRERDAREHDRLDEGAADDDGLAAVLVRPDAPQRDERQPDDEDQRAEEPDEGEPVRLVDAHLAQVRGQQREDLADARGPRPSR